VTKFRGYRLGYSYESQKFTVCYDIVFSLHEGARIDAIIIDFSKAFDSVPNDRLLTKTAASGADSIIVVWVREILSGRSHRNRVGGQLSEEVRVKSGVPQGSVLGSPLLLAYVNDIWSSTEPTIRLFADDGVT
jgi:hypothetical protein